MKVLNVSLGSTHALKKIKKLPPAVPDFNLNFKHVSTKKEITQWVIK
jgi:hypothetical protein